MFVSIMPMFGCIICLLLCMRRVCFYNAYVWRHYLFGVVNEAYLFLCLEAFLAVLGVVYEAYLL